jgi:hypothetical protein
MRDALFKFSLSLVTPYSPKLSNIEQRPHRESCILIFLMAGDSRWRERVDCDWLRSNEKRLFWFLLRFKEAQNGNWRYGFLSLPRDSG